MTSTAIRHFWALLKIVLCATLLLTTFGKSNGQNQAIADSISNIYAQGNHTDSEKLILLNELARSHTDTESKLSYSTELIELALSMDSVVFAIDGYVQKGYALRLKSDLSNALESYLEGAKLAVSNGFTDKLTTINIAIGDLYSIMDNHDNAIMYYARGINLLRELRDTIRLASALLNAGDEYFNYGDYDKARAFFRESGELFRAKNYEIGVAYNLGNEGLVYAEQGKDDLAQWHINEAIKYLEKLEDYYPISVYLMYMADIQLRKNNKDEGLAYLHRSLALAKKYGLKEQIKDANSRLSEIYQDLGNYKEALIHYQEYNAYRDSINNLEAVMTMADLRTDYEVAQKQAEIDLLEKEKEIQLLKEKRQQNFLYVSLIAFFFFILLMIGLYRRYSFIKRTNQLIEKERDRSDKLLLNILPEETAEELKLNGSVQAKKFDSVTVMFTDFENFTASAERLSPGDLVNGINYFFSKFDEIMEKHGLEKIKTIGDAYMCAAGLPYPLPDHAFHTVLAALEIQEFMNEQISSLHPKYRMRIGIHTGPVVAGVVGTKKFAYDIWGDTVNIASRMESHSKVGNINISDSTYNLIKDRIRCTYRGEINVKNKGNLKMYFVEAIAKSNNEVKQKVHAS